MLFNSYIFWLFFAIVFVGYRALGHRGQNYWLLGASWIFYGWWDWRFLFLLIGTSVMDYFIGLAIDASPTKRGKQAFLTTSIVANLGLLGFFKYAGFLSGELTRAFAGVGIDVPLPVLHVVLPVGISFYTFQELSYVIDVYRGETKALRRFPDFLLYVAFFPQLMAGPIERSSRLIPQVLAPRRHLHGDFSVGTYLVLTGLFRKVIIGDNMAGIANAIFTTPTDELTGAECLIGVYAFALQIYGDFSGYSAIAQGIARWLGFDLMTNFRHPYFALSPSDFWRRWHISLSTWLRDYLYIPLGGNRGSALLTYRNLFLTMLVGGIWHGAAWTFIAWGAFHGLLLCIYRPIERRLAASQRNAKQTAHPVRRWFTRLALGLVMFHLVCFGWLMFRATSMAQVGAFVHRIFTDFHMTPNASFALGMVLFFGVPLLVYEKWLDSKHDVWALTESHWLPRGLVYAYCVVMLWLFVPEVTHEFIYFQF